MCWKHLKVLLWRAQRFYQTAKGAGRIESKEQGRAQERVFDSGTGIAVVRRGLGQPECQATTEAQNSRERCHSWQHQEAQQREPPGESPLPFRDLRSPFKALTLTKGTPASVLASSLTLGHLPQHSEPQFLHLQNGNNTCPSLLFGLNNWFINIMLNKESKSQNDTPFMANVKWCRTRL